MRYIILALLFAVVTLAAGFLALSQKREPQASENYTPPPSITQNPTSTQIQQIVDEEGGISYEIPSDWNVMKEGAQGVRISGLQSETPDFVMRTDEQATGPFTPIYYDSGAHLQVSVQNDIRPQTDRPVGEIIEETQVIVDGIDADYFRYKEPSTLQGEILDVRFSTNEKSYFFRFGYNPETLSNGENIFFTIIDSVNITE